MGKKEGKAKRIRKTGPDVKEKRIEGTRDIAFKDIASVLFWG